MIRHTCGRATSVREDNSQSRIYLLRACYLNLHILFIAFKSQNIPCSCFINSSILKLHVQFGSSLRRPMMTVQSDRYTKPVFRFFSVFYWRFSVSVFFKNRLSLMPRKFIIAKLSIGKLGSSSVLIMRHIWIHMPHLNAMIVCCSHDLKVN